MNRITKTIEALRAEGRKALVPYIVSGDPSLELTVPAMHALVEAGADILELGIAFSDPTAEGPVIQRAHERALKNRASLRKTLAMVAQFRETNSDTPVVLMGYANPVEKMGYQTFTEEAKKAGVDGVLTVDLPPEEAVLFTEQLRAAGLENIFLVAPTTTSAREISISELAGGYIYYVSVKGVTGAGNLDVASVEAKVEQLRKVTDLPICVGFGIKDGASARAVSECSDGAVVGSVIVNRMAELAEQGAADEQILAGISELVREMRTVLDA